MLEFLLLFRMNMASLLPLKCTHSSQRSILLPDVGDYLGKSLCASKSEQVTNFPLDDASRV